MTHLFVSHATADDKFVTRIHDQLEAAGIATWVDHHDIPPGADWDHAIHDALITCEAGLYVLSARSADRDEIRAEIRTLINLKKRLYIALIEPLLPHQFPYRVNTIQYVDLDKDFDGGMSRLIAAITGKRLLVPDAPHTLRDFRVSGTLSPEYRIPMSGRDADLAQVIADLSSGAVTSILGLGGLGKSRLAAEVVVRDDWADGAVWHVASAYSTADDALTLIRDHLSLPRDANRADILSGLRARKTLVVIDNAESVTEARRHDYVALVNDLSAHHARVLITGRVEWHGIKLGREHHPRLLELDAARAVVLAMAAAWGVAADLSVHAERIARAARQHPRLIEWSVRKIKQFPPDKVIRELETFKGADVQAALNGMIGVTVEQMVAAHGEQSAAALRRLLVFQGGFTYQAAGVILGLVTGDQPSDQPTPLERYWAMLRFLRADGALDDDALQDRLRVLQTWQFVTYADERYAVSPLVSAALAADDAARQPHVDYYWALAKLHRDRQDFAGLDGESDNLTAAFEWALAADTESALRLANDCGDFLSNRGRFRQNLDWFMRLTAALAQQPADLRAGALNSLGLAYWSLAGIEAREANLRRAITAYEQALTIYTSAAAPLAYALTQNNLGVAYSDLAGIEDREANLRRAIAAYEQALIYRTPAAAPLAYAGTQNNLGTAYADLAGIEDWEANLRRAIAAYEQALTIYTPAAAPLDYAATQNNLGAAYRALAGIEDRERNLRRAIAAYEQALTIYMPAAAPLDYAMTHNNLGNAFSDLAKVADREANLRRAIAAYTEALKYRTPAAAPLDYAGTQRNLGIALKASGDLSGALACWREAEIYYRRMGTVADADLVRRWIEEAEAS